MLLWLRARNVALLDDVSVDFDDGLHVVTGETGAGKSLLLESLGLALGARGRARLVGPHGDRAVVEAGFSVESGTGGPEAPAAALAQAGIGIEDGEIILRRELRRAPGARSLVSRAAVNGRAVPVGTLRTIGAGLAEIFGQGEHLALHRPGAAREILDSAGRYGDLLEAVALAHDRRSAAAARIRELAADTGAGNAPGELERALREIEDAAPQPGEKEALDAERRVLGSRERLLERLHAAWRALSGSEHAAGSQLGLALRELDDAAEVDPATAALLAGRPDLLTEVEDLAAAVRDRRNEIEAHPERLAEIEDRLALLRRLERRHTGGGGPEALLARAEELRTALDRVARREATRAEAAAEAEEADAGYRLSARKLTAARHKTARSLAEAVTSELPGVGLPKARFEVGCDPSPSPAGGSFPDPPRDRFAGTGWDRLELRFGANPGIPPAPLAEVASGGESSRFFLALRAAGAERETRESGAATLVFDEVDAGTSGRIADAVGRRLRRLAARRQVLCVTHVPQVAAIGNHHLQVEKLESEASVRVRRLSGAARTEEIARMLAGPETTEGARQNAEELLRGAGSGAPAADPRPADRSAWLKEP